jgi:hypothetical protein
MQEAEAGKWRFIHAQYGAMFVHGSETPRRERAGHVQDDRRRLARARRVPGEDRHASVWPPIEK